MDDDQTRSFVALAVGTQVSQYKILSKIGAGGMGEVWLAEDSQLDRKVALKFLPPHLSQDKDSRARFTREARAAAKLDHPNIVPVFEVGEYQGRPYFAMAHIEGDSLRDVIKKGKLDTSEAVDLTMQICEGLHKAHESGVVHRDIKPGNIIIDQEGRPRILDFGLATVSGEEKLTKTGSTLGTVGYMAPEQVQGKKVDHRSDLFSVGVILYEMLTGRRPFEGDNDAAVVNAITNSTPEPIARFKSGVTGELQQIIDKALTKDPSLRYQHADGMLADLKRLGLVEGARRSRFSVAMLAALPVVIILAAAIVYTQFIAPSETEPVGPKRVAVLPFENLGDPEKEYFASGMTDEITTRLAKVSGLAVIPRGTSARYGNTDRTMQEIGRELSADYIVDGTVRWQESADGPSRIRVGVHLINVDEDAEIWSETYDTVITEVFSIQSEVAENVSEQMGIKLDVIERRKVWERYTSSQEAYDFYLQGNRYINLSSGFGPIRDFQLAAEMYHKAIALDSNFVVAIRRLSYTYSRIWGRGDHSDSIKTGALEMAHRAFELDHDTSAHNRTLASYYYFIERDMKRALEHLNEAYEDDLNSTDYLSQSHIYLRSMGDWEEAYRRMKILQEREPNDAFTAFDLGQDCLYTRRYEEAEVYLDRTIELRPDFYTAYQRKVLLYLNWQGDIEKARDVIRRSRGKIDSTRWRSIEQWLDIKEGKFDLALSRITIPPYDSLSYYINRAAIHKCMNEVDVMKAYYDSAYVHVERFLNENPENANAHSYMGIVHAGLGRKEEAIREGKRAVELAPLEKNAMGNFAYLDYLLQIYILLQEKEEALATLERMLTIQNYYGLAHIFIDPDYAPMLGNSGFDRMVEKYGNEYARELWQKHLSKSN